MNAKLGTVAALAVVCAFLSACSDVDSAADTAFRTPDSSAPLDTTSTEAASTEAVSKPKPARKSKPTPAPEPWQGPTDGVWDYGDVGYAQPFEPVNSDYRVTVVGLPTFGPVKDDKVTVTGVFNVERVQDLGWHDEILDDLRFGFTAGSGAPLSETYGLNPTVECEGPAIEVGQSTECSVAFSAPTGQMQDFEWWVNGDRVAAWPGQTVE